MPLRGGRVQKKNTIPLTETPAPSLLKIDRSLITLCISGQNWRCKSLAHFEDGISASVCGSAVKSGKGGGATKNAIKIWWGEKSV